MLQAMNTGHEGSLSTCHANSPDDALRRSRDDGAARRRAAAARCRPRAGARLARSRRARRAPADGTPAHRRRRRGRRPLTRDMRTAAARRRRARACGSQAAAPMSALSWSRRRRARAHVVAGCARACAANDATAARARPRSTARPRTTVAAHAAPSERRPRFAPDRRERRRARPRRGVGRLGGWCGAHRRRDRSGRRCRSARSSPRWWSRTAQSSRSRWRTRRRRQHVGATLPGALDEIARSLRSGASLAQAIEDAGAATPGPIGDDLTRIAAAHQAGMPLAEALRVGRASDRCPACGSRRPRSCSASAPAAPTPAPSTASPRRCASTSPSRPRCEHRRPRRRRRRSVIGLAPLGFTALACLADPSHRHLPLPDDRGAGVCGDRA